MGGITGLLTPQFQSLLVTLSYLYAIYSVPATIVLYGFRGRTLHKPTCCHIFDVSITRACEASKITGCKPPASSGLALEASLFELIAHILATGVLRLYSCVFCYTGFVVEQFDGILKLNAVAYFLWSMFKQQLPVIVCDNAIP